MKIGAPVNEIPASKGSRSKYSEIYRAVSQLPNGDWLPVECDSNGDAKNLYQAAKIYGLVPSIRKKTVYLQKAHTVRS